MIELTSWISADASEVCKKLRLSFRELEAHNAFDQWSYGDTIVTLVGNKEFLAAINEAGAGISEEDYWSVVPDSCYINLEN